MSRLSRRSLLANTALAPVFAGPQPQTPARATNPAVPARHLLAARVTTASLEKDLVARAEWRPYAKWVDRAAWAALPPEVVAAVKKASVAYEGKPYEPLPASLFLEYARNGNRSRYEAVSFGRRTHLRALVLEECIEGKGRLTDRIADGLWSICEESFWGVPAHMGAQKRGVGLPDVNEPIIDLFAAETAAGLAWVIYLMGPQLDGVHKLIRERVEQEIERRVLSVYRVRDDFGWMGLKNTAPVNNWNPWINSNVLTCALLLDADAPRRARTVLKVLTSTDRFLDGYAPDGGCDEGPSYWNRAGAALFEVLDLVKSASAGKLDYFDIPLVRQIGAYIYRAQIAGNWYVNFADASAKVNPDASLVYRYGRSAGDADLAAFGAWLASRQEISLESFGRALPGLFGRAELTKAEARDPLPREAWMPGIGVAMARRTAGSSEGLYFAAQGGHNAESHNHNDVGNFVVYSGGEPLLIDVGVETYTAKTFGSKRYEIWTMQSANHNLPTVNGVMQAAGRQYEARDVTFRSDDRSAEFALNIAAAYPKEAGIEQWLRRVRLDRGKNSVAVTDRYTLNAAGKIELSLMTTRIVKQSGTGVLDFGGVKVTIAGPSAPVFRIEEIPITDGRLKASWGSRLCRVVAVWDNAPARGELVVTI